MTKSSLQTGLLVSSVLLCPLDAKGQPSNPSHQEPASAVSDSEKRAAEQAKETQVESA